MREYSRNVQTRERTPLANETGKSQNCRLLDDITAFDKEFDSLHRSNEDELKAIIADLKRIANTMANTSSMLEAAIAPASDS
ncbi:hypothetical protein DPMN_040264 [Dreissena polymorpha]|uniref:Uncharacterized protein n=1 Tax=Dreissena polymorpha TaxID=45954 RepID=A0A9D4CWJ9_DREPO|nr:hypothetical protein DPMN_040264 [Dreissena polymorpha]